MKAGNVINRIFRPSRRPLSVPFGLRSVGHVILHPDEWRGSGNVPVDFAMIYWIVSGTGLINIKGNNQLIKKNDVFCYNVGAHTKIFTDKYSMEYRFLTFDGIAASLIVNSFQLDSLPFKAGPCPVGSFDNLYDYLRIPDAFTELETSARLYQFLVDIVRNKKANNRCNGQSSFIDDVYSFLNSETFSQQIGVNEIAESFKMERSAFSKKFKIEAGVSPKEYIDNMKIQQILHLLQDEKLTIRNISRKCGFSSPGYMAKFFKKKMGMIPSEFRDIN